MLNKTSDPPPTVTHLGEDVRVFERREERADAAEGGAPEGHPLRRGGGAVCGGHLQGGGGTSDATHAEELGGHLPPMPSNDLEGHGGVSSEKNWLRSLDKAFRA